MNLVSSRWGDRVECAVNGFLSKENTSSMNTNIVLSLLWMERCRWNFMKEGCDKRAFQDLETHRIWASCFANNRMNISDKISPGRSSIVASLAAVEKPLSSIKGLFRLLRMERSLSFLFRFIDTRLSKRKLILENKIKDGDRC